MSQLILSRGNTYNKNIFQKFFQRFEMGPYFLISSLVLFVVLVTIITLMFSTSQVTKGYVLNKLEFEHQTLIKDNERMEMKISEVRSLDYIEKSSKVQSMRRPMEVAFVNSESTIASR